MAQEPNRRKPVRPSLRFEIFKRDGFTCQYCGGRSPEVVLEVDHIVPVAGGGSNDPENLITACYMCNRGKSDKPLSESMIGQDLHDTTVFLLERETQLREYNVVMDAIRAREESDLAELVSHWDRGGLNPYWLDKSMLRTFLQTLPRADILRAMDIAIGRRPTREGMHVGESTWRYLVGILKNFRSARTDSEWPV